MLLTKVKGSEKDEDVEEEKDGGDVKEDNEVEEDDKVGDDDEGEEDEDEDEEGEDERINTFQNFPIIEIITHFLFDIVLLCSCLFVFLHHKLCGQLQ